ncbi:MAG: type II secretion system F family protein [Symbiobacteriia bacterium]
MSSLELVILGGVFVSTVLVAMILLGPSESDGDKIKRRLDDLVKLRGVQELVSSRIEDPDQDLSGKKKHLWKAELFENLDRYVAGRGFSDTIKGKLRKANLKLQVSEFVAMNWGIGLALGFLGFLIGGLWLAAVLLAIGIWLPWYYLGFLEEKRIKLVGAQLPDALNIMSNAMKSGYSLLQAMEVVSREMPVPLASEFALVLKETRVNIAVEDALFNLTQRVPSADLDLIVTAMLIQRQIGGNLSDVLEKINETIRERIRILGEVRTLTAQGRMSGLIVGALPLFLGVIIQVLSPGYMNPLFSSPLGWMLLGTALVMETIGVLIIRSMIHLEV